MPPCSDAQLRRLYDEVDLPLVEVLALLELRGIRVDLKVLSELAKDMNAQRDAAAVRVTELAGEAFNLNSPSQLAKILYGKLGLPVLQRTAKTKAPSTDEDVLGELALRDDGEIARELLKHRQMVKLLGTYVEALPQMVNPITGRVHTKLHAAVVASGRLASSDPNLQNIPIRTEEGRRIRGAFVPEKGWVLLDADYSQIELRVVAALAQDPVLLGAFEAGEDIHRRTASEVMGVPLGLVTSDDRAKAVNWLLYGQGAFALAAPLASPRKKRRLSSSGTSSACPRSPFDRGHQGESPEGTARHPLSRIRRIPELESANPA